MKITGIKTFVVNAKLRNWIFVRVETDQPGLYGLGEATLEFQTRAVVGAIEDLALLIQGEDPRRIEHLWQTMYRHPFFKGGNFSRSGLLKCFVRREAGGPGGKRFTFHIGKDSSQPQRSRFLLAAKQVGRRGMAACRRWAWDGGGWGRCLACL